MIMKDLTPTPRLRVAVFHPELTEESSTRGELNTGAIEPIAFRWARMIDKELFQAIQELKTLSQGRTTSIPVASDGMFDRYEQEVGVVFPEGLRFFVKEAGNVIYGTKDLLVPAVDPLARGELKAAFSEARAIGVPPEWIPICEDNGDFFCFIPNGEIRFFSHDGVSTESWASLAEWIRDVWIGRS